MFKKKSILLLISFALILTLGVGCSGQPENKQNSTQKKEVTFGHVNWPGVTVKTEVAKQVLEALGYKVNKKALTQTVLFEGMKNDEIDAFLGNWMPTMKVNFKPYNEEGVIENVTVNLEKALYQTAVPKYVWEAGVKSMADLNKYADKFDHKIIGIEPGNDGNQIIQNAIENNNYNLKDWKLVSGSTAAMLSAVGRATKTKEWIAFNGWKPHWMNVKYDIKYLDDPEGIWGGNDKVYTAARPELKKEMPNFYKFLEQFKVNAQIQSKWILEYQKKGRPAEEVAQEWIKNNIDLVKKWVSGIKTVDEKDAVEVIEQRFK
ncbi:MULTISPECIES: ABC transporter substrate-binding protein [unclassified Candidatus Frackibacter]|uniref:ABC transporter substrate-binding protein n=1 Tax=unclassified Candidatus Frackibacter TaxID=2648818 RepID=UPI00088031FA|nr:MULTISPECIES: ABC transporter substrate-binding protein [unclassified Candidatus Frackibacter]SDC75349.1 glycine betaine/proline transport system substrate-binding protein [Candidatus Frackibacter sp. WG11]SEM89087.1 glycine betaine/proline transport system substrate-binding protein [Candidatus Frackibacter sp. WG12]SFL98530.1 glycine betaine/proline transport system substrate-binding protein [Candidatus Frackibacter sp. WG13]